MYHSPFRIIDAETLPQEREGTRRALALEKKKLLAEFELAGSASISLDGQELHRQEVLSLFEDLGKDLGLRNHLAIWRDKSLLRFLEEGVLSQEGWKSESIYDEPSFLDFVSPHYAAACDAFMRRALNGAASAAELQALHSAKPLLNPADTDAAYRYVTRFFTEKKNELFALRHRAENDQFVSTAQIKAWCSDDQIHLLNKLPEQFATLRYTLANLLNNLCVVYDQRKANRHALAAIERAAAIRVDDEELRQLIPANLRVIRSKQSRTWYNTDPVTGRKTPKVGLVILLMIVVIRIASSSACNGGNQYNSTEISRITYTVPQAGRREIESLLQLPPIPAIPGLADSSFADYARSAGRILKKAKSPGGISDSLGVRDSLVAESSHTLLPWPGQ